MGPDGQPETEVVEHVVSDFRVVRVFDVSQTYGEPLPELAIPDLTGQVQNFPLFYRQSKNYPLFLSALVKQKEKQRGITAIKERDCCERRYE